MRGSSSTLLYLAHDNLNFRLEVYFLPSESLHESPDAL